MAPGAMAISTQLGVRVAQAEVGAERLVRTLGQEDAELVEEARRQQRDDKGGGKPGKASTSIVSDSSHEPRV